MTILFLPIDIDLSDFEFEQTDKSQLIPKQWNPWWETTVISRATQVKNQLDRVLDQLPFKEITTITYKRQEEPVAEHVDVANWARLKPGELAHIQAHEPAGYRLVITGSDDALEVYTGREWIKAHTPAPGCYVINSTQGLHRVRADADRSLIYIRGILDSQAHSALVEKSLKKYGQWAISRVDA